jgi:two-component system nitrogen regulation response regulator NtrX
VERVGSNKLIAVDVRVLAATNKKLDEEIAKEHFRKDLFHRLNVIPIHAPALREHRDDISILAHSFIDDVCARNGIAKKSISNEALNVLMQKDWPGNVRELRNAVERLVILSPGTAIDISVLDAFGGTAGKEVTGSLEISGTFQDFKERAEAAFIKKQLEIHKWNITKAAEAMEIQRSHLYTKMKRYGLMKDGEEEGE